MAYSIIFFIIFTLCRGAPTPPPFKKARIEVENVCMVQTAAFRGEKTECEGTLQTLSALSEGTVPPEMAFGAKNLAELLLLRSGIFEDQLDLNVLHVCPKHRNALGLEWVKARPRILRKQQRVLQCKMPELPGLPTLPAPKHRTTAVATSAALQKGESLTIFRKQGVFVPVGTGKNLLTIILHLLFQILSKIFSAMCTTHEKFVKKLQRLTTGEQVAVGGAAEASEDGEGSSSRDGSPHHGHRLRHKSRPSVVESPMERRSWTWASRGGSQGTCPVSVPRTPSLPRSSQSLFIPEGSTSPDSQQVIKPDNIENNQCKKVKDAIRNIANAIGLPKKRVSFPRKERFLELATATQAKRVNVASHITGAIMEMFAPDAPHEFFKRIIKKYAGDIWDKENSEKFVILVEEVLELYRGATTRLERLQTLALIAPMMRYLELQKYYPGLTLYAFKEARRYAKMSKAGMPQPKIDGKKDRYKRANVESFIGFITSSLVINDMPFGHREVKLSTGEKLDLPNMIRTTVNQRIIMMYKSYLQDMGQEDLMLSESSMWRILKACKAITRKSLMGLDTYTYMGVEGISNLLDQAEEIKAIDGDQEWARQVSRTLRDLKIFFKTDYKTHIQEQSQFADYSRWYALSDPKDELLSVDNPGNSETMQRCAQCAAMTEAFKAFRDKIESVPWENENKKKQALFVLASSKSGILEWQKHIVSWHPFEHCMENLFHVTPFLDAHSKPGRRKRRDSKKYGER